ncbi:macrophage mannose receptor 1 isoform X1 [Paramisgurnus dabryanus]|uniref:macrophage mannose receptor 1 isoform X1 n=1 Tax=Paramisgurnus dabryanus TaxID=90735 RepID=UPI0031F3EDE1
MLKHQRGAVTAVMNMNLFVLFLLSGLLCSASGLWRKYQYINISMTWAEAQSYCRVRYTDLATVDSINDVNRMLNTVNDGYRGSVWIGLKRGTQDRWVWSNGENTFSQYSNWATGQPNGNEYCVCSFNGFWHDMPCDRALYHICYNESTGYVKLSTSKNWTDAQNYCRQNHTDLATVRSSQEQNQLDALGVSGVYVWIGLFMDSWQWSDQWSRFYRNWAAGYTSRTSGSGDCVAMTTADSGKWVQYSCDIQRPFICHGAPKPIFRPYHYIHKNMTWGEAQSYCRVRYTDLATVDSINDVNRMLNTVNDGYRGSVWIGLKRGTQDRWVWSNGENTISQFSNWYTGQPNGNEYCVFTYNGFWHDMPCDQNRYIVCYNESTGYVKLFTPKNWTDAQSYCRQYHSDLATVRSSQEQNQLDAIGVAGQSVWIGLFMDSWQWSDQWDRYYRNWAAGYTSRTSGSGDCVAMTTADSGNWVQYSCDLQRPFICHGAPKPIFRPYHYIHKNMTWAEAQSYCRVRYTDLATVDSINDVNRMLNTVNDGYGGSVWIGLKRGTQDRWVWSNGENTFSQFSNWYTGQPNGNEYCVFSYNGFWHDMPCDQNRYIVCYNESTGYVKLFSPKNWTDAQSYCRQYHSDLATVRSSQEQNQLDAIGVAGQSVWIGLFMDSWQWSDQWDRYYRNWAAGYTSRTSGSGDCVAMTTTDSGKWVQYSCDQKLPIICYGEDKQTVRSNVSCDQRCSLNDPAMQTAILNEINEKLNSLGLESYKNIAWIKD